VTGHTGFKGAWLTLLLAELEIPYVGLSLDPEVNSLYVQANLANKTKESYIDIRDFEKVREVFFQTNPSAVIHMAAQPLVLKSYSYPLDTYQTNVMGTANLLQIASETKSVKSFIGVTTDKVYRNKSTKRRFLESDPLEGKDPYSASKVGAESALAAWRQISEVNAGPRVLSVRAGNVIGGGDYAEDRIIPDLVRSIINERTITIRNPESTRPWQHVLDPLFGYLLSLEYSLNVKENYCPSFNFGPATDSLMVADVVKQFKETFKEKLHVVANKGNASKLESINLDLDSSLATKELDWSPRWSQNEAINLSALWWDRVLNKHVSPGDACLSDIQIFLSDKKIM
jgi:CDP-glucose 4,6-dehydratase